MFRGSAVLLTMLALAGAAGCATNAGGDVGAASQAQIEIENRSSFDMDLYVRSERGGAVRLGLAPSGETTFFSLSPSMLAGAGVVRFEGRPVRGQSQSVLSDPYKVRPGEALSWSIPPQ